MTPKERAINSLVSSASSRFAGCETEADWTRERAAVIAWAGEVIDGLLAEERARCEAVCWEQSRHWRAIESRPATDFNRHYAEASAMTAERIASLFHGLEG